MRFSTILPTAALLGLFLPATASAQVSTSVQLGMRTGFVRVNAPAPETGDSTNAPPAGEDGAPVPEEFNPEEEAMTLFSAGKIAFRNQNFRRALEFFQDARGL